MTPIGRPPLQILVLGDFCDDAEQCDLDAFAEKNGQAYLLHHGPISKLEVPEEDQDTLLVEGDNTRRDRPFNPQSDFLVFPLHIDRTGVEEGDDLVWIGRSQDNDVVIPDATISAVHAFIKPGDEGTLLLQDMQSKNGTQVNDEPVVAQGQGPARLLHAGDRIRFGRVDLTFLMAGEFLQLVQRLLLWQRRPVAAQPPE